MSPQQGEGIRATSPVPQGGTIDVEVGPNDTTVEVSTGSSDSTTTHPVPDGKTTSIPVPPVPPGTIVSITVGMGMRARIVLVEVVAPPP